MLGCCEGAPAQLALRQVFCQANWGFIQPVPTTEQRFLIAELVRQQCLNAAWPEDPSLQINLIIKQFGAVVGPPYDPPIVINWGAGALEVLCDPSAPTGQTLPGPGVDFLHDVSGFARAKKVRILSDAPRGFCVVEHLGTRQVANDCGSNINTFTQTQEFSDVTSVLTLEPPALPQGHPFGFSLDQSPVASSDGSIPPPCAP